MKILPIPPIDPIAESEVRDLFANATPIDQIIQSMRSLGLGKIDSMKLLRNYGGMRLGQAKDLVELSDTWADRQEADEAFHDMVEQAALEAGFVQQEINVSA